MSKKIQTCIVGWKFYEPNEDYQLIISESGTKGYYHVIYDSAFQDNDYFHLTKDQLLEKFKITI